MHDVNCKHCRSSNLVSLFKFGEQETFECNECGKRTVGDREVLSTLPVVQYQQTKCYFCGGTNHKEVRGRKFRGDGVARRHHFCLDCKLKFASEQEARTAAQQKAVSEFRSRV